jgi:hypothetical protein
MDELEVTLNTKANRSDLDIALSLTGEQADALNVLLGTKANQSDVDAELALKANQTDVALTTEVPSTTDILNNTNVGATAVGGAYASVNVVNKTSGEGVDFNFTIPPGPQGETREQLVQKDPKDLTETRAQLVWTRTATYPLTVLSRRLGILQRLATDD